MKKINGREISVKHVIRDFIFSLISFLCIIYILFTFYTFYSVWSAAIQLSPDVQTEYIRLNIYGSSSNSDGNTISAAFSIVDSNGNEIATIERSWSGTYLSVEFAEANINGKRFLFPTCIYGKDRIMQTHPEWKKGTSLEKFYDDNGQCLLLGFGSTLKERRNLYKIARFATKKIPVLSFGHCSTYSLDLSACKTNVFYSIQSTASGDLVVVEL